MLMKKIIQSVELSEVSASLPGLSGQMHRFTEVKEILREFKTINYILRIFFDSSLPLFTQGSNWYIFKVNY